MTWYLIYSLKPGIRFIKETVADLSTIVPDFVDHTFDPSRFYANCREDGPGARFEDRGEDDTRDRVLPGGE